MGQSSQMVAPRVWQMKSKFELCTKVPPPRAITAGAFRATSTRAAVLYLSKERLAGLFENLAYGGSLPGFNHRVQVNKRPSHLLRQNRPHGRLAGSHESDQVNQFLPMIVHTAGRHPRVQL